eukprot:12295-Heterococcus_DN1.PRE.2
MTFSTLKVTEQSGASQVPGRPNAVIPISNDYFEGAALLLLREEGEDAPYSFGVPDNAELPHISFPLLTNVDSLIVTKPGEQPPELGQQLHEDAAAKKERTAAKGFGALDVDNIYTCVQHTCMLVFLLARPDANIRPCCSFPSISSVRSSAAYANRQSLVVRQQHSRQQSAHRSHSSVNRTQLFSFNSMYIDMPRWSTCKIPVLKDMDLHTFWGSSALRVAAYYLLSSDPAAAASTGTAAGVSQAVQHLQKDLRYLLCIQVQHTTAADAAATAAAAVSSEAQSISDVGEEDAVQYRSKPADRCSSRALTAVTVSLYSSVRALHSSVGLTAVLQHGCYASGLSCQSCGRCLPASAAQFKLLRDPVQGRAGDSLGRATLRKQHHDSEFSSLRRHHASSPNGSSQQAWGTSEGDRSRRSSMQSSCSSSSLSSTGDNDSSSTATGTTAGAAAVSAAAASGRGLHRRSGSPGGVRSAASCESIDTGYFSAADYDEQQQLQDADDDAEYEQSEYTATADGSSKEVIQRVSTAVQSGSSKGSSKQSRGAACCPAYLQQACGTIRCSSAMCMTRREHSHLKRTVTNAADCSLTAGPVRQEQAPQHS